MRSHTLPSSEADAINESLKGLLWNLSELFFSLIAFHCSRIPISVEDGSSVPAEEGDLIGRSAAFAERDDGKSASTAGLPVDCDVLGVGLWGMSASFLRSRAGWADLDQIGIPRILGDAEIVIALLL
jgi:hypothetical protein